MRDLNDIVFMESNGRIIFGDKTFDTREALAAMLERREKMAGRRLSQREHLEGAITDTRSASDQMRDGHWLPVPVASAKPPERNIFRSDAVEELVAHQRIQLGKPVDRKKAYELAARAEDERLAAADAKAAYDSAPERIAARKAADELQELARYSRDSSLELLILAKRARIQAEHDLSTARKMHAEFLEKIRANAGERRRQLDDETAALYGEHGFDMPKPKPIDNGLPWWPSFAIETAHPDKRAEMLEDNKRWADARRQA